MNSSELISRFSHEIRNPLTLINSSLQFLETDCPAVLDSPLWPQIRQDMDDVLKLLSDMSTFNKCSHITPASVSLSRFLSNIEASFRPMMQEHGICFTVSIDEVFTDAVIQADERKLKEAITNLLLNAIDAVSENSVPSHQAIALRAASFENHLCLHVTDNGPGIPTEYLDSLFTPFVTHKSHGTGLGLSIAETIVRQHGGSIKVETGAGSGADFCICLPFP